MTAKLKILDIVVSIATLLYGIWLIATSWPEPGGFAITVLVLGAVALPLSFLDPMGRLSRSLAGKLVKKA